MVVINAWVEQACHPFFRPFVLKQKDQKFKADINGPTH